MVFNDGSATHYGRGQALRHWMNYARVTDYISAACVVFRRAAFHELGGFDVEVSCWLLGCTAGCWWRWLLAGCVLLC